MAFDMKAALAQIAANPQSSGDGRYFQDGGGAEGGGSYYDSSPFSRTNAYFYGGKVLQPQGDGTFLAYSPSADVNHPETLNGTMADVVDAQGNVVGQQKLSGIDSMGSAGEFASMLAMAIGGPMLGGSLAGAGAGAGMGAGVGGLESGALASGVTVGGPMSVGMPIGTDLASMGAMAGMGGAAGAATGAGGGVTVGGPMSVGLPQGTALESMGAMGGTGLGAGGASLQGIPPPTAPGYGAPSTLGSTIQDGLGALGGSGGALGGMGGLLGPAATALGGILGSKAQQQNTSSTRQLPDYLQGPITNDLIPRTQGLLNAQMPQAQQAGQQMMTQGSSMMNLPMAGNGYGQVKLNAPTTNTNPYLGGMADDISRRTQEMLGQNNLGIQGNFVASGGLGGSRQGVAQGVAAGKAADYLQGNLANLYGTQYSNDQNRALSQYGMDQSFYGQQRGQDLSQTTLGAGLVGQGLQTQWAPIQQASNTYSPFSGFGTTTGNQTQGGGAMGMLGGALGAAQLGKNAGWW